ncbi:MAG: TrmB family transcriptional regulator [Candidatus Micrarchaeota archaeon]|nr:TrmB family transcriptional regulator [Candidatus Micrarchaeota archaeon]
METKALSEMLVPFGLTRSQAVAYLALLRHGPMTATEIYKKFNTPRTEAYNLMTALGGLGVVESSLGHPMKFHAVKPGKAIETLISFRRLEIRELEGTAQPVVKELSELRWTDRAREEATPRYLVQIYGKKRIHNSISMLLRDAKDGVQMLAGRSQLKDVGHNGLMEELEDVARGGIEVKLLINGSDGGLFKYFSNYNEAVAVKLLDSPSDCWFALEPGVDIVLSTAARERDDPFGNNDLAVHTNAKPILDTHQRLFELLWNGAAPFTQGNKKISVQNNR